MDELTDLTKVELGSIRKVGIESKPRPTHILRSYPWHDLKAGTNDCFTVHAASKEHQLTTRKRINDAKDKWTKRNGGVFTIRSIETPEGLAVRVWRLE